MPADPSFDDLPSDARPWWRRWQTREIALAALLVLSLVGIGITDFSPDRSRDFWTAMVPAFGLISLVNSWYGLREQGRRRLAILRLQALHWLGLLLALSVIYFLFDAGRLTDEAIGLLILLSLALTTFLAGVHFDWTFCVVGLFLGVSVIVDAWVEALLWVMLLGGALVLAATVVIGRMLRRRAGTTVSADADL